MDIRPFQTLVQIGLVAGVMAGFAFAPPARGRMLLVPLSRSVAAALPATAVSGGARLLGEGPVTGSLVVEADRARLVGASPSQGVLILSAPAMICGQAVARGRS